MRLLRASLAVAAVAVKPGDYFDEACHEDALTDHDLSHVAEHQHHHPYVHEGKTSSARACASFEVMWNMNMFDIEEICGGECPHEVNLPHHFYYDHKLSTLKVDAQHYRLEADLAKVLGDAEHEARLSQLAEAADLLLAEELYHDYASDDQARIEERKLVGGLEADGLYSDATFPASGSSLYYNEFQPPKYGIPAELVEWNRIGACEIEGCVEPVVVDESPGGGGVVQGAIRDRWFLSSLGLVQTKPEMLAQVLVSSALWKKGIYTCKFFKAGKWRYVHVDDRIPCKAGTTTPVFCRPAGKELWVVLLEKAFAKFVGGYPNLAGGFSIWALQALTGDDAYTLSRDSAKDAARPWYRVDMKHAPTAENPRAVKWLHHLGADGETERFADDLLFDMLLKYDRLGFIMNASTCFSGRKDGLVGGHAYSLIAAKRVKVKGSDPVRLLQLRNPWGNFEWTGRWSDASAEWTTHKKVAKACGVDPGKPSDDGVFWMAYEDFLAYFDSIDVLKRTEDLHDIYLDTHEDMKPRVFGPLRGCVVGLCRYFVACQGVRKLCCGRAPTGDDTVEVDQKRLHCCGRQWC